MGTAAQAKITIAYISDSPSSSVPQWIAKETGIFKKYGLDIDLVFIDGSTRGIQALLAGDLGFTEAVGTSAINGKTAGGNIAIINGIVNTLPYYIIGNPAIKSRDDLKGRTAAVHIPGTAADFALRLALKSINLPYNQIKAITVGGGPARIGALINGQAEFTIVSDAETNSRRAGWAESHHRYRRTQSAVPIYLHRHFAQNDSRAARHRAAHGRSDRRRGSLL